MNHEPTRLPYFEVNAFTTGPFSGNPAGVVIAPHRLSEDTMKRIAAQNNLAETAFVVPEGDTYRIRWFTPTAEIDLCGHATLGTAYALLNDFPEHPTGDSARFLYAGGTLHVRREGDLYAMDFPVMRGERVTDLGEITAILGEAHTATIEEAYLGRDLALVLSSEEAVREFQPDYERIASLPGLGFIITARGTSHDIVSRAFFPKIGIPEDPVTGAAHCFLAWIWSQRLGRNEIHAYQASKRGGEIWLSVSGARVTLRGRAEGYLSGEIAVREG